MSGYYCISGASKSTPQDGLTGDICPTGHYCPEGSSQPEPCPAGTYLNITGQDAEMDCISCPLGEYCPGEGRSLPAGLCDPGFYCPGSQNQSAPTDSM